MLGEAKVAEYEAEMERRFAAAEGDEEKSAGESSDLSFEFPVVVTMETAFRARKAADREAENADATLEAEMAKLAAQREHALAAVETRLADARQLVADMNTSPAELKRMLKAVQAHTEMLVDATHGLQMHTRLLVHSLLTSSEPQRVAQAGYTAYWMHSQGGFSLADMCRVGFPINELAALGFSDAQLKDAGYPIARMREARTVEQLQAAGFSRDDLRAEMLSRPAAELRAEGHTASELRQWGASSNELHTVYTLSELCEAQFGAGELHQVGYAPQQLYDAGFDCQSFHDGGVPVLEAISVGFSARELAQAGYESVWRANTIPAAGDYAEVSYRGPSGPWLLATAVNDGSSNPISGFCATFQPIDATSGAKNGEPAVFGTSGYASTQQWLRPLGGV